MSRPWTIVLLTARRMAPGLLVGLGVGGCHHATDPTPACFIEPPQGTTQTGLSCASAPGSCGACGTGGASVTASFVPPETFAATVRFRVHGARPNTTYIAQRAPEVPGFGAVGNDRQCQRANGLPPFTAADGFTGPAFVTFPRPNPDPKKTLTTDAAGDGSLDFDIQINPLPGVHSGLEFDVMMRLVDDEAAPTSELRTACMSVRVS